jgi:hypothetical protein
VKAKQQKLYSGRKPLIIIGTIILVPLLVFLGWFLYVLQNPVANEIKPLEQALTKEGATTICSIGDSGKGFDNKIPNYSQRFSIDKNKDNTVALVSKITEENGYKLSHQDAPSELVEWFTDLDSKQHELRITVNAQREDFGCPDSSTFVNLNGNKTGISVTVTAKQ